MADREISIAGIILLMANHILPNIATISMI